MLSWVHTRLERPASFTHSFAVLVEVCTWRLCEVQSADVNIILYSIFHKPGSKSKLNSAKVKGLKYVVCYSPNSPTSDVTPSIAQRISGCLVRMHSCEGWRCRR